MSDELTQTSFVRQSKEKKLFHKLIFRYEKKYKINTKTIIKSIILSIHYIV